MRAGSRGAPGHDGFLCAYQTCSVAPGWEQHRYHSLRHLVVHGRGMGPEATAGGPLRGETGRWTDGRILRWVVDMQSCRIKRTVHFRWCFARDAEKVAPVKVACGSTEENRAATCRLGADGSRL
jgi:hypothetical protein